MKNIHILPTPNPSRLIIQNGNKLILGQEEYAIIENRQNIYITSDEEIKEGDWFIFKDDNTYLFQSIGNTDNTHIKAKSINEYEYGDWNKDYCKKIILTTDQDLIKDGVQAIDDEFLEWFVQNPSCEVVEVEFDYNSYKLGKVKSRCYKIIIPQDKNKYSEEEVIELLNKREDCINQTSSIFEYTTAKDWFEQFKKK